VKRYVQIGFVVACVAVLAPGARVGVAGRIGPSVDQQTVRFAPVHIYLDSGEKPLAAYQFELKAVAGKIKIVGVEGGEHEAFQRPPYYDSAALMNERIILAAFNTGDALPTGRTRIATVHLQIIGDTEPQYELDLTVAADRDGRDLAADLTLQEGEE
jgi:hypothetical protein